MPAVPTGFAPAGCATFVLIERDVLKRPGGGKQCADEGHRLFRVRRAATDGAAQGPETAPDARNPIDPIELVCRVCRLGFRVDAARGGQPETEAGTHEHHWHAAKANADLPATDAKQNGLVTRRFACCNHPKGGHAEMAIAVSAPRIPGDLLAKLLAGSDIQKKNVIRSAAMIIADALDRSGKVLNVWANEETREKTKWFKVVEWRDDLSGSG